jgi:copper(I)-binding protein
MIATTTEIAMHRSRHGFGKIALASLIVAGHAHAAGKLGVHDAWIRAAPPGADMAAGYATLTNTGDQPIAVLTVQSDGYRMTSLHETITIGDVSKMRELHRLKIAPGETVQLKPGGKHLMLMQPRRDIAVGEKVEMMFLLVDGARIETYFDVVAADVSGD